jgi:hypothetical protein
MQLGGIVEWNLAISGGDKQPDLGAAENDRLGATVGQRVDDAAILRPLFVLDNAPAEL